MDARHGALESLVIDARFWNGRRVFVTGHTGFKGAWLSLLLSRLGAQVFGFALAPANNKDLFVSASVEASVDHVVGDIREYDVLRKALERSQAEIVLHLAAQSLVRYSYQHPMETYATNVMGTVHLLECIRHSPSVRAAVIVTSDKCYENQEWIWGYRETDRLGGRDPYSNSKACAELVTSAYRSSFLRAESGARVATARAGNVIGGGDWSLDRLVPDAIRAFGAGKPLSIRNPAAVRPWQHVLDPVAGYLVLAERLMSEAGRFEEEWNFGPPAESEVPVATLVEALVRHWGQGASWQQDGGAHPPEANFLRLDCSKSRDRLGWRSRIDLESAIRLSVEWYRACETDGDVGQVTQRQLASFVEKASTSATG
jgi:CDP-glucose 4,6-dehydratase